ncbi:MAG TPA: ABC transporter permease [Acidimicrobiales bacterium]|nr:ABC transporter permease [Acidimicrobiales bacterium]
MPVSVRRVVNRVAGSPVAVTFLGMVVGLVIGGIIITVTTGSILDAWRGIFHSWRGLPHAIKYTFDYVGAAYRSMFEGSVVSPHLLWHLITTGHGWVATVYPLSETLTYATPLMIAAVGVGITFQAGLFNIGANGQAILGAITGGFVGVFLHLPTIALMPLTLIGAMAGGALAGAIPGVLKSYTGAHEVIVTLMFNYVVNLFLLFTVLSTAMHLPNQGADVGRNLRPGATLSPLFGVSTGLRVNWGLAIAAGVVVFAWWLLERSSLGFEFRVSGANPHAAQVAGINSRKVTIVAFMISGALAGLAGITQLSGVNHYLDGNFLIGSAGIGFTAITVSLLGRNHPIGIVWGSLLFAALGVGGRATQAITGIPNDLAIIVEYVIVLCVATPAMIQEIFRLKAIRASTVQLATAGWGS